MTTVNRKVVKVISEKTEAEVKRSRGMPKVVHKTAATYLLECGHTTTRRWARNRPVAECGHKLKCETCSSTTEATRASA